MDSGARLGHYEILGPLGAGGMGEVYRGRDTHLDRDVAIKILPEHFATDVDRLARFEREAKVLASLNHANIAAIYGFEDEDDRRFIVMEVVEGETLAERISRSGCIEVDEALDIARQVAEALEAAHDNGVIHRDLKPANVKVTPDGQVKVLDFGLAKAYEPDGSPSEISPDLSHSPTMAAAAGTGVIMGTAAYMSPEQARGTRLDKRTDIWSFGCVLYEILTGVKAFGRASVADTLSAILEHDPEWGELPRDTPATVRTLLARALRKDARRRLRDIGDARLEFEDALAKLGRRSSEPSSHGSPVAPAAGDPDPAQVKSIAVLPLTNLSADPEQEYFSDGMTEALITDLAKIRALKVISRTSVMRYKSTDKPLQQIAQELNVDGVVEGSVLRAADRVRITAQLIHAATDTHLWAESYEGDLRDVLVLQSEVARAIAKEIQVVLTREEEAQLALIRPVNLEAYDAYLKGLFHFYKLSPDNTALDYFGLALEKDPDFALALTGIADVWGARACMGFVSPDEALARVRPAIQKAIELDDTLAEAHEILARLRFFLERNWAEAERESQRAIELNPNNSYVGFGYWFLLLTTHRIDEARVAIERALELDPLSFFLRAHLGLQLLFEHRYDEAVDQARAAIETEPSFHVSHWVLWMAFHKKGLAEEAVEEARRFYILAGNTEAAEAMGRGYNESGYRGAMRLGAEELVAQQDLRFVQPTQVARLYAHAEEKDLTLNWLEKAYAEGDPYFVLLDVDVAWNEFRDDPRFQELLRRMSFSD